MNTQLAELRDLIKLHRPRRPRSTANIFFTYAAGARTTRLSFTTMYRWKRRFGDFPRTPFTRVTFEAFIRRKRAERWNGVKRLKTQARVLTLKAQGRSPAEIIAITGLSRSAMYRKLRAARRNLPILREMRLFPYLDESWMPATGSDAGGNASDACSSQFPLGER